MAVAKVSDGSLTIIGAPRYQHKGVVRTVQGERTKQIIVPYQWQVGIYHLYRWSWNTLNTSINLFNENCYFDCFRVVNTLGRRFVPWTWMLTTTLIWSSYLLQCTKTLTEKDEFMFAHSPIWYLTATSSAFQSIYLLNFHIFNEHETVSHPYIFTRMSSVTSILR